MCDDNKLSPTSNDINLLFDEIECGDKSEHQSVMQKLQAIRLWQLKQQEELKKQQQTQLALLKSQSTDVSSLGDENEEEILAVPLTNFPGHLDTILEQSTVLDETLPEEQSAENGESLMEKNDSILDEISKKMVSIEDSMSDVAKNELSDIESDSVVQKNSLSKPLEPNQSVDELHSDIETSFEKVSPKQIVFDDVPINGGKTFEEILAEQIAKDKSAKAEKKPTNVSTPKRPFLRKGQGIARFNGPPKKPRPRKKPQPQASSNVAAEAKTQPAQKSHFVSNDFGQASGMSSGAFKKIEQIKPTVNNDEMSVPTKPCVRKTARLNRRDCMKQLSLIPESKKSPNQLPKPSFGDALWDKPEKKLEKHNESAWSDQEDTVLALDASCVNAFNTTSNETFEQMEEFCNEFYADISTVKTLEDDDSVIMQKIKPLPPNKLMLRLFPTLRQDNVTESKITDHPAKSKVQKAPELPKSEEITIERNNKIEGPNKLAPASRLPNNSIDSVQSELLKNKLEEMQAEIKHFQEESAKLSAVRKQEENQLQVLKQEFDEFQQQKEDELERLSEFKKSEIKKLKKDRKLFEEHAAAAKALPNKKDRDYIQELEGKIEEMQNEFKLKEQRFSAVSSRLRSQVETAVEENDNLKEKVKKLEATVRKFETEKESRKSKKSQAAWKAINKIVDAIPVNNENSNIDNYIESHTQPTEPQQPAAMPLPMRSPLSSRNDNNFNSSDVTVHEGKIERRKKDGSLEISFQNGTKKLVFPDGTTQIKFTNGDIKTVFADGIVKYHYTVSGTWHTTHPNGMQVIEFSNKQIERHFPDGSKHITFEDGSSKMIKLSGSEETIFPDGTVMILSPSGDKTIEYSNGQREIHTAEFKRREYPDGTCKTVFADGRQETKYSSGRLRIKDSQGVLIVDKMLST